MSATRLLQYCVYVVAMSLLASLSVWLGFAQFTPDEGVFGGEGAMAVLPMALAMIPYSVLQVIVAAVVIRPLFLWRLFALSVLLLLGNCLLAVLAGQIPPGAIRQMAGGFASSLSSQFALLIPVVVLAIFERIRSEARRVPEPSPTSAIGSATSPPKQPVSGEAQFKWRWYYWDIGLASVPLWFGILFDPSGILSYLGGLINVPLTVEALMMSVMLIPAALLCPVILLVRMLFIWPRHIHSWGRLLVAWAAVVFAFSVIFILPSMFHVHQGMRGFMAGFKGYVERRSDVEAVQAWLGTLDPKDFGDYEHMGEIPIDDSDLPPSITCPRPRYTRVTLDEKNRPMIRLEWGSGVMGSWGLVVGDKAMPTPPSDLSRFGEYRMSLAPGAYVWYGLE